MPFSAVAQSQWVFIAMYLVATHGLAPTPDGRLAGGTNPDCFWLARN